MRHVGISFHDRPEVLEQILTEYPEIEVVQIQFNYADYDDPSVQSRECYEVCVKHHKPVIVMEPVKGGNLVNLPEEAKAVLDGLHGGSPAQLLADLQANTATGIGVFHRVVEQVQINLRQAQHNAQTHADEHALGLPRLVFAQHILLAVIHLLHPDNIIVLLPAVLKIFPIDPDGIASGSRIGTPFLEGYPCPPNAPRSRSGR